MAKKQTIIKNPVGNGNISITIENNLKNTNPAPVALPPPVVKKRRRRRPKVTDETDETLTNSKIEDMLMENPSHRSSLVLFKGSFKDPKYCSLGFLEALVKRSSGRI